ncbi:MAG TPA: type III polyketide synthase [Acetobacteraceae bacterium]|nr:type III polyketide synthase [Acetobacteraceae bacterium]
MTQAWLNRIGTAVPPHDIHAEFVDFARSALPDARATALFDRMVTLADIQHRFSFFEPGPKPRDRFLDSERFYRRGDFPTTADRMARFESEALTLAMKAIAALDISEDRAAISHLIVATCTGFTAPGLDFHIMTAAGLAPSVERTVVGFMGCFAAVNALKLARHVVRSEPRAKVLVVNLELSGLHLQEQWELEKMLSFLLFGDGSSASLVSAEPVGLALDRFHATVIPRTADLITWHIRDQGFEMHLSGQVPGRIRRWLMEHGAALLGNRTANDIASWAVHAGGRSILDAVQHGLALRPDALRHSRDVLREFGNMSSATLMFVLDRILRSPGGAGDGVAMAFGPGLSVEAFAFRRP